MIKRHFIDCGADERSFMITQRDNLVCIRDDLSHAGFMVAADSIEDAILNLTHDIDFNDYKNSVIFSREMEREIK